MGGNGGGEAARRGGVRCAWHPSLLCLLLPLPEDVSFSPPSRQPATQFTLVLISLRAQDLAPWAARGGPWQRFLLTLPWNFWETRVGRGTGEQGRVIASKQAQGTQALTRPATWVDWEPTGPTARPSLSFPQGPGGQDPTPAQPCYGLPGPVRSRVSSLGGHAELGGSVVGPHHAPCGRGPQLPRQPGCHGRLQGPSPGPGRSLRHLRSPGPGAPSGRVTKRC